MIMKTGDKARIIKVCAPFISESYLGKVSKVTITKNGVIYLDDLGFNAVLGCISKVEQDSIDEKLNYVVYDPFKDSSK